MSNLPPPGVNPKTGEILDEDKQIRPFAELLTILDRGEAHAEASRGLNDLVAAVNDTGKSGSLTITIKIAPLKGSSHQLLVAASVSVKPPRSEPGAGVFYIDDSNNLTRTDPNQPEIEGLRIIEPKPARTVTPGV
jgi:hypothetical protein